MIPVLCLFAGLVLGWCARVVEVQRLVLLLADARAEAKAANDRLVQAWREGYHVPEEREEPLQEEPLSPPLQELVNSYPDPTAAARVEAAVRRKLNSGRTEDAILMDAEVGQL